MISCGMISRISSPWTDGGSTFCGVRGRERIRKSLKIQYPFAGGRATGFFTCHQLIQPVIHVSEDGRSADIRVRLFQLSGPDGTDGVWMAGILEKKAAICRFTTSTPSVEEGRACYYSDRNTCLPFGFSVAEHHGLMYKFVIYYNI